MERRFVDLELQGFEAELHRRNQTVDIPKAERMRYWLAGWKQCYAVAFDADHAGPDLAEGQCLERLNDWRAYIADREKHEDVGTAAIHTDWIKAFVACFEAATGKTLGEDGEPEEETGETVPEPAAMAKMPWMARRAKIGRLTGQTPRDGDEARDIYGPWFAAWYREKHGSDYAPA